MSQDLERRRPRDRKKRRRWRRWRISIRQALAISVLIHAAVLAIRLDSPGLGFAKPWAERRLQAPDIESLYLMASPQYSFLSSSGIKELAMFGGNIDEHVTPLVARRLKEELAR